jgi:putative exosortase-associated protein (TIGR04073 family)
MFKNISFMGAALLVAALVTGCAGPEKKLGRGINNTLEPIRLTEWRRTVEQDTLFNADGNMHTSMVKGFNRTIARAGLGLYEIVTFPIPSYDPIFVNKISPKPEYPDSFEPGLPSDPVFRTDTSLGFNGGDVAPFLPGSRFHIFDN